MSKNIVFEGWLTKSPPTKRIWRAKWRRRWFALRHSGDLPGQYFLDYYADRTKRRPKGTIDLDLCEQVDAGLHMERGNALDTRLRGSVFTVRTHHRSYHLEADSEADMTKWVEAICRACGLRSTEDANEGIATYQNSPQPESQHERVDSNGVYIPISECITGVRVQDQRAFTFDPNSIMASNSRDSAGRDSTGPDSAGRDSKSQPPIRVNNVEFSENDDDVSDDDCKSLNASQSNIDDEWSVAQSFTKLAINSKGNEVGPPVPPRPPKLFQGPKMLEPEESDYISVQTGPVSQGAVPKRPTRVHHARSPSSDDEESHTVYISQGAIPKRAPQTVTHHTQTVNNEDDPVAVNISQGAIPKRAPQTATHHTQTVNNDDNPDAVYISQGAIPKRAPQTATHHTQIVNNENGREPVYISQGAIPKRAPQTATHHTQTVNNDDDPDAVYISQGAIPKRAPQTATHHTQIVNNENGREPVNISQGAIPKRAPQTATHQTQTVNNEDDPVARKNDEERKPMLTEVKLYSPPPRMFTFDERSIAAINRKNDEERKPMLTEVKLYSPPPRMFTFDERSIAAINSLQYCNLSDEVATNMARASTLGSRPPVVNRKLKPIYGRMPRMTDYTIEQRLTKPPEARKTDVLHYLDLDLPNRTPVHHSSCSKPSVSESNYNYKTVDFLKTEAFNLTRRDAEAFRNLQC